VRFLFLLLSGGRHLGHLAVVMDHGKETSPPVRPRQGRFVKLITKEINLTGIAFG
jgi:hypothetical protein